MQFFANKSTEVFRNNQILIQHIEQEVRKFLTGLIELVLEEEFRIYIGRKRYERRTKNDLRIYRNGYRVRNYLTIWSKLLRIKVPRCRVGNFSPILFRKGGINSEELTGMFIQLWVEGSSYRDLATFVKRIYGEQYSIGIFSRMIGAIQKYVDQYHERKIEHSYDCVYIDGLEISIKELPKRTYIENKARKGKNSVTLGVLGQRREGKKIIREMIDYRIGVSEDEKNYTDLLASLRQRGLTSEKIGLVVHDGHLSITKAIKNVYKKEKVIQQECLIHQMRNVVNKIEKRSNKDEVKNDVWKVYSSKTEEEFLKLHKEVMIKWSPLEPEAMKQFEKINSNMLNKYKFDIQLHKDIHSNNPIERYFREIRRRIKAMGVFETVSSADRLLFLIIEYLNQRRGSIPTNTELVFTH